MRGSFRMWWGKSLLCLTLFSSVAFPEGLETLFKEKKWEAAAQAAYEALAANPNNADAAAKGAFALFQKGYPNAALVFLSRLTSAQWDQLANRDPDFVDMIALLQKQVPLTVLSSRVDASPSAEGKLRDENLYAKGREFFEKRNFTAARTYLTQISPASRYFTFAHYLLATLAIEEKNYDLAAMEISRMYEPTTLNESTEFWRNLRSEVSQEAGASLKVMLDPNLLARMKESGQLGTLAVARIHYAKKEYDLAIKHYERIPEQSRFHPRSRLERIWTRLQMNEHDRAAELASKLGADESSFEAVEARTVRAIILADKGDSKGARDQIETFMTLHKRLSDDINKFMKYGIRKALPPFVEEDLKTDSRIQALEHYARVVAKERQRLMSLAGIYPVYGAMAGRLSSIAGNVNTEIDRVTKEILNKRLADLRALYVQARLVRAETYLEDRENLREKFQAKGKITEEMQKAHDRELVALLTQAVEEVEQVLPLMAKRNLYLEFRQAELVWELGRAYLILSQSEAKEKNTKIGEKYQNRALVLAEDIANNQPSFPKNDQARFFAGFAHIELGNEAKGIAHLKTYVQTYPHHENVSDAYRILADHEFDNNRFANALVMYNRVIGFKDSPIVGYAHYKAAWSAYNLQDYAKAMLSLEKAILWARKQQEVHGVVSLRREARRDLITIYAEVGDAHKAYQYFEGVIGEGTYEWVNELAKTYDDSGQYEKAVYLYNVLLSLNQNPAKNVEHYTAIIQDYVHLGRWTEIAENLDALLDKHGKELRDPQPEGTTAFAAEKVVRDATLAQHFEFKETEEPDIIERIVKLDKAYFAGFGKWPSAQDPLYKHAYFLYRKKRYPEAVLAYEKHWTRFKDILKEPLREEALRNLLNGLEKVETQNTEPKQEEGDKKTAKKTDEEQAKEDAARIGTRTEMSPEAERIIQYAGEYAKLYPKSEHARAIAFVRATILLRYSRMDQGITENQAIFDADVDDKFGKAAFQNLRVAYYQKKDWEKSYNWATSMLERSDQKMRQYHPTLATIREESLFLWADQTQDDVAAAELFLKAARDPRMQRLKDKSLYNAIVRLHKADKRVQVLELSNELDAMGAQGAKSVQELSGIRAALYQEAGDYKRALPLMEGFLKQPGKDVSPEILQQARLNAALMSQGLGNLKQAVALYNLYIQNETNKTSAGAKQADAAMKYLQGRVTRKPAATFAAWPTLMAKKERFIQAPLPAKGSLGARIKSGVENLEAHVKLFVDTSSSSETPDHFAFEAYCVLPYLYKSFSAHVLGLAQAVPEESREAVLVQLRKVTDPLDEKTISTANDCIEKSMASRHNGEIFRSVNQTWGWEKDPADVQLVSNLVGALAGGSPWLERIPVGAAEPKIIERHIAGEGDIDTWYSLGRRRMEEGKWQLARLTFIDALNKQPPSTSKGDGKKEKSKKEKEQEEVAMKAHKARILNALAVIEWAEAKPDVVTLLALFEKAAADGSAMAYMNLALLHLREARKTEGIAALRAGLEQGALDGNPQLKETIARAIAPPPEGGEGK